LDSTEAINVMMNAEAVEKSFPLFISVVGVDFLSMASYICLLCVLHRNQPARHRLFPRQLRSLAMAGLCVYTLGLPVLIVDFWHLPESYEMSSLVCSSGFAVFRACRLVSVLQETHIALTFLAQSLKWIRCLPILNRCIPLLWFGGLLLGAILQIVNPWRFDHRFDLCVPPTDAAGNVEIDYGTVTVLCFSFAAALASLLAIVRKTQMPAVVRRQNFQRAMCYPLISVASFSPAIVAYVRVSFFWDPPWYLPMMVLMECSNGFLNVLAFAVQSRYALFQLREAVVSGDSPADECVSFRVDFGGVDIVDIVCCSANSMSGSGSQETDFEQQQMCGEDTGCR
jgi:hypothetical protein